MARITASHLSQGKSKRGVKHKKVIDMIKSNQRTLLVIGYKSYEAGYQEWLQTLNYNAGTVYYSPQMVREFLNWLEENKITTLQEIQPTTLHQYFDYLKTRTNKRKNSKLKANTIKLHHQSIKRFSRYLKQTGQTSFEVPKLVRLKAEKSTKTIFTKQEIETLYHGTENTPLGIRDKAMLAIYYGCGLRRSEGAGLETTDILFDKNLVYVRKGKNYKERYVPMSETVREDLQYYVNHARNQLIKTNTQALFINRTGQPLQAPAIAERFNKLKATAGINKQISLHGLRHSIATHLLQSGMKLEQIARFLGHSSLESTQIYTHLAND